jgi:hypothetical protein
MGFVEKGNVILEVSFEFALEVIAHCELLEEKKRFVISYQLLKSGTHQTTLHQKNFLKKYLSSKNSCQK